MNFAQYLSSLNNFYNFFHSHFAISPLQNSSLSKEPFSVDGKIFIPSVNGSELCWVARKIVCIYISMLLPFFSSLPLKKSVIYHQVKFSFCLLYQQKLLCAIFQDVNRVEKEYKIGRKETMDEMWMAAV